MTISDVMKREYRQFPKEYDEKFELEEDVYQRLKEENPDLLVKILQKYETKNEYGLDEKEKEIEVRHDKVSIPVIKSMMRGMRSDEQQGLPGFESVKLDLEDSGSKVFGTLFDRLKFLKIRIDELEEAIEERRSMNVRFNKEIEKDVSDLEIFLEKLSAKEDIREFKLNITLLRMDKRKENNLFWRDITALKKQLRELKEEYENEFNISKLFSGVTSLKKIV